MSGLDEFVKKYPARKFEDGEVVVRAGEPIAHLFYLSNGYARRFVHSVEGKELTIHIFEEGSVFPISLAINGHTPEFSVSSLKTSYLRAIPMQEFLLFLNDNPHEVMKLLKKMTSATEGLAKRVEILSLEKADSRLLSTLLYLEKHFGRKLPFTHEEIATLTGLSRERVSIEMKKLKDRGIISYKRSVINITDKAESILEN